jgi:iron complex transport system substrate-binding protein
MCMRVARALLIIAIALTGCDQRVGAPAQRANGARRIVSLAPAITETLFALGAGPEVVGVSQYCDYPPQVVKLPKIGSFLTPNIEAIAGLWPTIVIGLETSSDLREVHALAAMGYGTMMVNDSSIAGIEMSIRTIGDAIGRSREARALLDQTHQKIAAIEERLRGVPQRRVLMVVGHQPMVAVGRGTYLEVILDGQMGTDPSSPSAFWAKYPSIPAVRDHRVTGYPEDPTLHPGPRIVQTLDLLARLIHPDAFAHRPTRSSRAATDANRSDVIALEPLR